jgi:DNA-binding protein H-NS
MNGKKETYAELKAQAEELLRRAEKVKKEELAEVIAEIDSKIAEYGITPEQLTFGSSSRKKKGTTDSKPGTPKYRNSATGQTWTGKGKPPAWIAGQDRTLFLIEE